MFGKIIPALLVSFALSGVANAELFDFRDNAALYGALDDQVGPVFFTNGTLTASFTASDGVMNRTGGSFGINSSISGDDADAFDVGEWINITFNSTITLTNVDVSSWSGANGDQATIYVNGVSNGAITSTGDHPFNINISSGQVLRIQGTGGIIENNGWSLDGISVSGTVVIPSNAPPVLNAIGNKSLAISNALNFTITASDADDDSIILSASNLPAGAMFNTVTNTGSVTGQFTWASAEPIGIYTTVFYATDGSTNNFEQITISVLERPELLISEVADPDMEDAGLYRFVELYNASANDINLAAGGWFLSKQVNGGTWYDIPLSGMVSSASAWVIANSETDFQTAYGFAPGQESGSVSGNGDDAYFLYYGGNHTNGVLIDIFGEFDMDGSGTAWDYEDSRAVRKNNILKPNTLWTASEWTIAAGATTNDMTPGEHGPVPEFQGLEDVFVFLGDDLTLPVSAVNTVRTDVITLSATNLPAGATFPTAIGTDTVSSTLGWIAPTAGTYSITFDAVGDAGTTTESITITVSSTSKIDGRFYGWRSDTIVKLRNGQFWRNTGGAGSTIDPPLQNRDVTITNWFIDHQIRIENVSGYTTIERIDIAEATLTNTFSGLDYENIYQLSDGTTWKQIGHEPAPSETGTITVWRWTENGETLLRFLSQLDEVIGTCTAEATIAPTNSTIVSPIDGTFYGWKSSRIFALENGQFWQQIDLDSSTETLSHPDATISNWLESGIWLMSVSGAQTPPSSVQVQRLTNVFHTTISGKFHGFEQGRIFKLANGSWWRQTFVESTSSVLSNPDVFLWNETNIDYLEIPEAGKTIVAEELVAFTGLRYGNLYRLDDDGDWIQINFETANTNLVDPEIMLWIEGTETNMLVRGESDETIGTCRVVDPEADTDGDMMSNAAEIMAGTDLFDEESTFKVTETTRDGTGHYVLRWEAVEGRVYSVAWTPSLTESFQPLETDILWPQNSWTDTVHTVEAKGFYRITVRLAD